MSTSHLPRPMKTPRILVVDDQPEIGRLLHTFLEGIDCEIITAIHGLEALEMVRESPPDVILLDIHMPGIDGLEVCRRLKAAPETRLVPVVMVTAFNETEVRVRALEAGADDFLAKPVERAELTARVLSLLRLKSLYDRLDDAEQVIFALARAVEAKDAYTEAHTERVARNAYTLGCFLGLPEPELDDLYRGGMIHDIGKIGVPDQILLKAGPLTPEEWEVMKTHPVIGEEIARPLRSAADLLQIVRHHHENVDGSGYPDGLAAEDIPLSARIVAVCDGYDALTSDRPYRPGMPSEVATAILRDGAGKQWDAELVRTYLERVLPAATPALGFTRVRRPFVLPVRPQTEELVTALEPEKVWGRLSWGA